MRGTLRPLYSNQVAKIDKSTYLLSMVISKYGPIIWLMLPLDQIIHYAHRAFLALFHNASVTPGCFHLLFSSVPAKSLGQIGIFFQKKKNLPLSFYNCLFFALLPVWRNPPCTIKHLYMRTDPLSSLPAFREFFRTTYENSRRIKLLFILRNDHPCATSAALSTIR